MESSDTTRSSAQRIDTLSDNGIVPTIAIFAQNLIDIDAQNLSALPRIRGYSDNLQSNPELYEDLIHSLYSRVELQMLDTFAWKYPDLFIFRIERSSEERLRKNRLVAEYADESYKNRIEGNTAVAESLIEDAIQLSEELIPERDRDIADLIAASITELDDPNLFVVATVGDRHGSGISHELLMRGIVSDSVLTNY